MEQMYLRTIAFVNNVSLLSYMPALSSSLPKSYLQYGSGQIRTRLLVASLGIGCRHGSSWNALPSYWLQVCHTAHIIWYDERVLNRSVGVSCYEESIILNEEDIFETYAGGYGFLVIFFFLA